jgi:hypothetical protein
VGVLFAVAAFSAFLFQFLSAVTEATQALSTVVLAIATIGLFLATRVLAGSTRSLAEIEVRRDKRSNFRRRIELGDNLAGANLAPIIDYLKAPIAVAKPMPAIWIRELKQLIPFDESYADAEIFHIFPSLDLVIMRLNQADMQKIAIENAADEEAVRRYIEIIQRDLRILVVRWRGAMPYL